MTTALVLIIVALALAALVVVGRRSRRDQAGSSGARAFARKQFRISWPPGYAHRVPLRTESNSSGTYVVEKFPSRSSALDVLRGCDVRDERVYLIGETPEGNIGRDLVWIFEEQNGSFIEIAERTPLPEPVYSQTDCAHCGYTVLPMGDPGLSVDGPMTASYLLVSSDVERAGQGFECEQCGALGCMHCYLRTSDDVEATPDRRCWLCQGHMLPFVE
ncbi:hypothetical protein FB381_3228 [Nocardioides albertanoniae]|uniref:Uncharacterized protein n=1 Tax=Nocardioides albertanoniae TaxID=1175486 RepID=A0A543A9N1_9ACTN|nr:hypothetical protein [Nocardioides albertanoniae]TQL69323.1 hypothetical protein FB381_3228 [Nocardioides albertanoniae]